MSEYDIETRGDAGTQPRARRAGLRGLALGTVALIGAGGLGAGIAFALQSTGAPDGRGETPRALATVEPARFAQASEGGTGESAAPSEASPFSTHAQEAGIRACAGLYDALGDSLTGGSRYSLRTAWSEETPDERPIEGLVGLSYEAPTYTGEAAGYVFAVPGGQSCTGAMVRVAPFQESCDDVPSRLPPSSEPVEDFEALRIYALADGGHVLLLPVASGCAVISTLAGAG